MPDTRGIHVMIEAETGVLLPRQGTSEALRGWRRQEGFMPGGSEEALLCPLLDMRLLVSRTTRRSVFVFLALSVCGPSI